MADNTNLVGVGLRHQISSKSTVEWACTLPTNLCARDQKQVGWSKICQKSPVCNSLVIVEKKDGSLRLCLDPKDLNSVIRHGNFQVPSFEDVVSCLEGRNISQSWTKGTPTGNYPWVKKALTYAPLILLWPIPLPMYATWNLLCIWGAVEENI